MHRNWGMERKPPPQPTISDWTVFWLALGLAVLVAIIGWVTT